MKTAFSRKTDNVMKTQDKRTCGRMKDTDTRDMPKLMLSRQQLNMTAVKA